MIAVNIPPNSEKKGSAMMLSYLECPQSKENIISSLLDDDV